MPGIRPIGDAKSRRGSALGVFPVPSTFSRQTGVDCRRGGGPGRGIPGWRTRRTSGWLRRCFRWAARRCKAGRGSTSCQRSGMFAVRPRLTDRATKLCWHPNFSDITGMEPRYRLKNRERPLLLARKSVFATFAADGHGFRGGRALRPGPIGIVRASRLRDRRTHDPEGQSGTAFRKRPPAPVVQSGPDPGRGSCAARGRCPRRSWVHAGPGSRRYRAVSR